MKDACFITYENRTNLDYYQEFSKFNRSYCQRKGYDYIQLDKYQLDIPDYWIKVYLLRDYIKQYKYVVWIDSDAMVQDPTFDIHEYFKHIPSKYVMACSRDPPMWPSVINAGVILVKSSEKAKSLLDTWISRFNKDAWYKEDGKWKTKGKWAGVDYEQGSLVKLGYEGWKDVIRVESWDVFCNIGRRTAVSKIAHVAGEFKNRYKMIVNEAKQIW